MYCHHNDVTVVSTHPYAAGRRVSCKGVESIMRQTDTHTHTHYNANVSYLQGKMFNISPGGIIYNKKSQAQCTLVHLHGC